jgi:hypothetical protein
MELTFTELENSDSTNNQDNYKTYYEDLIPKNGKQQMHENIIINKENHYIKQYPNLNANMNANKKILKPKKKKISYDDILSSMNTVVIDGKLEFIRKDRVQNNLDRVQNNLDNQQQQQQQQKRVTFNQLPSQPNNQPQINKNSYIYNKYFKDYKEPNVAQNEPPRRPLTRNELIKQIIINKAKAINERNRIAEIKSTKLLFNNNNKTNIVINSTPIHNPNGMNHLFRFK